MQIENLDLQVVGKLLDWGILGFGVKYLAKISGNVAKLNEKIAKLFERTENLERERDRHDDRITYVERHLPRRK